VEYKTLVNEMKMKTIKSTTTNQSLLSSRSSSLLKSVSDHVKSGRELCNVCTDTRNQNAMWKKR